MVQCVRCREGQRQTSSATILMSVVLIATVTSIKSFSIRNAPGHQLINNFCSLPTRSASRSVYRSSQLRAALDDDISMDRLPFVADQGTPSAASNDPLSLNGLQIGSESTPITPLLIVPSETPESSGFKDIPSISSTASPSPDSTLTFSGQPKTQATFTLLNRLRGITSKLGSSKRVKLTTWDSPRLVSNFPRRSHFHLDLYKRN